MKNSKQSRGCTEYAFQKTNKTLADFKRQQHKLEQYSRRECSDITDNSSSVDNNDSESLVLRVVNEIRIKIDKMDIFACHRLERTYRMIVKFLKCKDAEAVFLKKNLQRILQRITMIGGM